jgi:hypothetical protein
MEKHHVQKAQDKHRYIMYLLKTVANRQTGMSFKVQKFHGIVHMAGDIIKMGVPLELDTGFNESGHKGTKKAAKLTQRNEALFDKQVAIRLEEVEMITLAMLEIEGKFTSYFNQVTRELEEDTPETESITQEKPPPAVGGSVYVLKYDERSNKYQAMLTTKTTDEDEEKIESCLVDFLAGLQHLVKDHIKALRLYSVHKRQDQIFRGQGRFRGKVWRDWVLVDWGAEGKLPSKIWGFLDLTALPRNRHVHYGGIDVVPGHYAVIETATFVEDEDQLAESEIFVPIIKEVGTMTDNMVSSLTFFLADVEAFVKPLAVIPDIGGPPNAYFWVKDRESWRSDFTNFLEKEMNLNEEISTDDTSESSSE